MFLELLLAAAPVHGGPPAFLEARVQEQRLEMVLTGEQVLLGDWFGVPGRSELPLDEIRRANLLAGAAKELPGVFTVEVDGQTVEWSLSGLQAFSEDAGIFGAEPSYELRLEAPLLRAPERLDFLWRRLPPPPQASVGQEQAPAIQQTVTLHITSAEGVFDWQVLSEHEPAYAWHRPAAPVPIELIPQLQNAAPDRRSLGWAALMALGACALAWILDRGLRKGRLGAGVEVGLRLGLLALLVMAGWRWFPAMLRSPGPPAPERAIEIFEGLHENMYRAFGGRSRDEIYDLLAASVDESILDALYGDIYESLILREEGGAVAQVDSIEVLGREFDQDLTRRLGGAAFGIRWGWRVRGRVIHFAHEHERVEQLEARYALRPTPQGWRIAGVEMLRQEREL